VSPLRVRGIGGFWLLGLASAACGGKDPGGTADGETGETSAAETTAESGSGGSEESGTGNDTGPENECDLCLQDCPEGDRCVPVSDQPDLIPDSLVCQPVDPDAVPTGERCQIEGYYGGGLDDCEEGAFCVLDDVEGLAGFCQATCCPDMSVTGCEPGEICEPFFTGYDQVPPVPLCMPGCDPLQPGSCDEEGRPGWTCIPTDIGTSCRFLCVPPTPVPDANQLGDQGEECLLWSDCKAGLHCQPAEAVGCAGASDGWCCTAYCDPSEPNMCPDGLACTPFGCEDPSASHVGACVLPGG
jgi:hypothetical protein